VVAMARACRVLVLLLCIIVVLSLAASSEEQGSKRVSERASGTQQSPRPSVLFMMSSLAVSGGNISILQEAMEMRRRGMRVSVTVPQSEVPEDFVSLIMALSSSISVQGVKDMVIVYDGECCWPKSPSKSLVKIASNFDIVVATYHTTASALDDIVRAHPRVMPAYYVQDYEPWFTCSPFECPFRNKLTLYNRWYNKPLVNKETHFKYTESTYSAVNGKVFLFAKTDWIKHKVETNHPGTHVHRVIPSIDHTVYFPESGSLTLKEKNARMVSLNLKASDSALRLPGSKKNIALGLNKVKIIAMLRPRTSRRNSMTCLDTLLKLAFEHHQVAEVSFFGVDKVKLTTMLKELVKLHGHAKHRNSKHVKVLGLLKQRKDLAKLYQGSDLFIDMSWWQAFGRTAVEAMACGCVPVMPGEGAGSYVCDGGRVCRYHDGTDAAGYYDEVVSLVYNHTERLRMTEAGIARAKEFSIRRAATSIVDTLAEGLADYRGLSIKL
jgi:glycosyltransferase involved in cell wall biosynthesis